MRKYLSNRYRYHNLVTIGRAAQRLNVDVIDAQSGNTMDTHQLFHTGDKETDSHFIVIDQVGECMYFSTTHLIQKSDMAAVLDANETWLTASRACIGEAIAIHGREHHKRACLDKTSSGCLQLGPPCVTHQLSGMTAKGSQLLLC